MERVLKTLQSTLIKKLLMSNPSHFQICGEILHLLTKLVYHFFFLVCKYGPSFFIYSFLAMYILSICLPIESETRLFICVCSLFKIPLPYWETKAINLKKKKVLPTV